MDFGFRNDISSSDSAQPKERGNKVEDISALGNETLTKRIELSEYLLDAIDKKCTRARKVKDLKGHTLEVLCVAFSPLGEYIASGSEDHSIKVWNAQKKTRRIFPYWPHRSCQITIIFT